MENMTFRRLFDSAPEALQKSLCDLWHIEQREDYHPEGNALKHTIIVFNRSLISKDINIIVAAFFHDLGKKDAFKKTFFGRPVAYGHENYSAKYVFKHRRWIDSLGADPVIVFNIVKYHMRIKTARYLKKNKLLRFQKNQYFNLFTKFSLYDKGGRK